jgi:hypothetical protein
MFINRPVEQWRRRHGLDSSGGRPARKNDNRFVGQKNYAAVRKIAAVFAA